MKKIIIFSLITFVAIAISVLFGFYSYSIFSKETASTKNMQLYAYYKKLKTENPKYIAETPYAFVKDGIEFPYFINNLIYEKTPSLQQAAFSQTNWMQWNKKTFESAKDANKLMLVSICYHASYYCYSMDTKIFDDPKVSNLINENFVPIKVDAVKNPEIEELYYNVASYFFFNNVDGLPLLVILKPDMHVLVMMSEPTSKELIEFLKSVLTKWRKTNIKSTAYIFKQYSLATQNNTVSEKREKVNYAKAIKNSIQRILKDMDPIYGGFGDGKITQQEKYPNISAFSTLIDEQFRNANAEQLGSIKITLDSMSMGGFYDLIDGGFEYYARDAYWYAGVFEKLLFTQARMALMYAQAYKLTRKYRYKHISDKTIGFIFSYLKDGIGKETGIYASLNARNGFDNGGYYKFNEKTIKQLFKKNKSKDIANAKKYLDLADYGQGVLPRLETTIIPFLDKKKEFFFPIEKILGSLSFIKKTTPYPIPENNKSIVLSWNALTAKSLIQAGEIFNNSSYINAGIELGEYLDDTFWIDGELYRMKTENEIYNKGVLEDYVHIISLYIQMYDSTDNKKWLIKADSTLTKMNSLFWDETNYGFYSTRKNPYIFPRIKSGEDSSMPSKNALAYDSLIKLAFRTGQDKYLNQAKNIIDFFSYKINNYPEGYTDFIRAMNSFIDGDTSKNLYAYNGKIKIQTKWLTTPIKKSDAKKIEEISVSIKLPKNWHLNKQDTKTIQISSLGDKWKILEISKPKTSKITTQNSLYSKEIAIKIKLTRKSKIFTPAILNIDMQGCIQQKCFEKVSIKSYL